MRIVLVSSSSLVPRRSPRLITELLALTKAWGWTTADLARELRLDETAIIHYRAGRRALTARTLARIAQRFGEQKLTRDLIWHYLYVECREDADGALGLDLSAFPVPAERIVRTYIERFAEESVQAGRGLMVVGTKTQELLAAMQSLRRAFEHTRVRLCVLRGDQKPDAATMRAALAAPLALIERIDFACDEVREIIRGRADLTRPTIVSSAVAPGALTDAYVRRIALSTMRCVALDSVPVGSPIPHAA